MTASLSSLEPTPLLYGATVGTVPESPAGSNAPADLSWPSLNGPLQGRLDSDSFSKDAQHMDHDG